MKREAQPNFAILPGSSKSRVVIHVPHAATYIPSSLTPSFILSEQDLAKEARLMADLNTEKLAILAADLLESAGESRPWLFINQLSRLVIDPERFPDESEEMNRVGMGAVYTRTSDQNALRHFDFNVRDSQALLDEFFHPYAKAFTKLVDERLAACGDVSIVDLHSYAVEALPYELHKDAPRPNLCIGVDEFHTPPGMLSAVEDAFRGVGTIVQNSPFAGTYVPLKHYRVDSRVRSVMLELRKDTYDFEDPESMEFRNIADRIRRLTTVLGT